MADYSSSNSPWFARISAADKKFKEWENLYKCARLEDYYRGFQWKLRTDSPQLNYQPYTLNLFLSTIQIKLANYLFQRPSFIVSPEPGHSHWDLDTAVQSAQLKQDILNTIVKNKNLKFARHTKLAALDSFFRFGMIEVGYAADWRNPLKEDPQLNNWEDPDVADDRLRVVRNQEVPVNEWFYIKRIKPQRFLVSCSDAEDLEDHEWVGYYQYYYTDTLRKTKGIDFPKNATDGSYVSTDFSEIGSYSKSDGGLYTPYKGKPVSKVWHIWDSVAGKRRMLLCDSEYTELWSDDFERLPLIDLRWIYNLSGFYPIPPTFNWLSPQDEINESREQIRSYRRRFTSKFQTVKGMIDEEEKEKFASGPDGVLIEVKQMNAIAPIENPGIGPITEGALIQAKDDFVVASGTSAEARPGGDRETATKSKIADQRSQIRENAEQLDFSEFINLIGREILCQAQEKMVDGLWVKYSSNPSEQPLQDMQVNQPLIKWIKAQDIADGYDFNISVDVQNATPAAMEQQRQNYMGFIAFLAQFPMIAMSPVLIRETAFRFGYTNEQVIHQLQQVAILSLAAKTSQAANQQGMTLGQAAGAAGETELQKQMQPPGPEAMDQQLSEQVQ